MKVIKITALWCPSCLYMNGVWNQVMQKYPNLEVISYDYDMDEEAIRPYQVGDILPVFLFFKDDKEVARMTGEAKLEDFIHIIEGCD